jgi:truncated hemoglobin YjbI
MKPKITPVFELIGGKETVMKFVPLFYSKVLKNEKIRIYFEGTCVSA